MILRGVLILLLVCATLAGEVLRISKVVPRGAPDATEMVLKWDDGEETLFVANEAIVTSADVQSAAPDIPERGTINVRLTEAGGEKMIAATEDAIRGKSRMAIVIEEKLFSAPVIQATPLGRNFVLAGFADYSWEDLEDLARRMSGKRALPRRPRHPEIRFGFAPQAEVRDFTKKEYRALKRKREEAGFFYLDKVPTRKKLNQILERGMTPHEVMAIYGRPTSGNIPAEDEDFGIFYEIAPERFPEDGGSSPRSGFHASFVNRRLESWGLMWSTGFRVKKPKHEPESKLLVSFPEKELIDGELEPVEFFEAVEVPDPKQAVTRHDLGELMQLASLLKTDDGKATVSADCDLMKTLAHNFPQVAKMRAEAQGGRVNLGDLQILIFEGPTIGWDPPSRMPDLEHILRSANW